MTVQAQLGTTTHRLIAAALADGLGDADIAALAAKVWPSAPTGTGHAWALRQKAISGACGYLNRLRPTGCTLIGAEVPLTGARADLVWQTPTSRVFIDEIKTGTVELDDPTLAAQFARLAGGGQVAWGESFAGVRLCALRLRRLSGFYTVSGGRLVACDTQEGWR